MIKHIKKIRVFGEYRSSGLFVNEPGNLAGEISHDVLDLPLKLRERLENWIAKIDKIIDWDDPGNSPEIPDKKLKQLDCEGNMITKQLQSLYPEIDFFYDPLDTD